MSEPHSWPSTQVTLLHRLKADSSGADWDQFVEVYGPLIYRFCRRKMLQDADAHDVAQNVLLAVRKGIVRFEYDQERGRFRSWLGTITNREIGNYRKQLQRAGQGTGASAPDLDPPDNDAAWIVEFNGHVYQAALDRIRPTCEPETWSAFAGVWIDDRPPAEVARQLDRTPAWVYRAKYRVLQKLKAELGFLTADIAAFSKK
jgi:RNA polymerase sigma-70 factor (ECF subfamily)